jgi:hypothetical protein
MANRDLKNLAIVIIYLFLAACSSSPSNVIPKTPLTPTEQIDTPTPTKTPQSTFPPQPTKTPTPIPTATFTPWPTKEVLLQSGFFGGDGGWERFAFIGRDMPELILYTDGQLIVKKEDENGTWFEETTLTVSQMCSFLSQIEGVGFFELKSYDALNMDNPMYEFGDITDLGEGGPSYIIQVNGTTHNEIGIYYKYVPYLVPSARRVFKLFDSYSSPSKLTDYQPQYMLLRIEKGPGHSIFSTPEPTPQTWPSDLPTLDILERDKVETMASAYLRGDEASLVSQVLLQDEQARSVFEAFGNRLEYKLFQSGDSVYYVAARPFLPHETLNNFSRMSNEKEFDLPFSCNN